MTFLPQAELSEKTPELTFIFDCGCINQIDSMGLQTLLQLVGVIEKQKIRVQFTNVSCKYIQKLSRYHFFFFSVYIKDTEKRCFRFKRELIVYPKHMINSCNCFIAINTFSN
jgi:hypothetical protein